MIVNVVSCTDKEVLEIEKIESDINLLQYVDCEPKQNEYGLFPFVLDGDTVRYKTDAELLEEHNAAVAEQAEQSAQPTQLDIIEAQVMYTALMTDTLIEEV